jgi:Flp pilus assembly protein CpaB
MSAPRLGHRRWTIISGWPRRVFALVCLLLAAWSAVHAARPSARAAAPVVSAVVAARNLPAGATIAAGDVRTASWPAELRPVTALTNRADAVGHRVAGPLAAGELLTSGRLVSSDLAAGLPVGLVAVPVPLVDPASATLIRAGNHVDLLSPPGDRVATATMVAASVLVLAVVAAAPSNSGAASTQLVVAVDRSTELAIAAAITAPLLATVVRPP